MHRRAKGRRQQLPWSRGTQLLREYWAKVGVFDRFKVVFSAALLLVMLILGGVVNALILRTATLHAAEEGAIFLVGFLQPFIAPAGSDRVLTEPAREALRQILPHAYISEEHVRVHFVLIRIWSPDGDLLFSSRESQLPPPSRALKRAMNDAYIQVEADLDLDASGAASLDSADAIGLVAPLHALGNERVVAVLEAYQNRGFIRGELQQVRRSTWTIIGIVSAILLGCLYLFAVRASRTIEAQQKDLIDHLGAAQRLAAENAVLTEQAVASRSRIARSNDRYLERIGADIHDGPLQTLSALLIAVRVGPGTAAGENERPLAADPVRLSLALYDELREIASGLALPEIKNGSLENAILQAAIRHERKSGRSVALATRGLPQEVPPSLKVNCYRIIQEALTNAYKHAGGEGQKVLAVGTPRELRLVISDTGPGMRTSLPKGRLGLIGMRNRVAALKGRLEIRTGPGRGTMLRVTIPLPTAADYEDEVEGV